MAIVLAVWMGEAVQMGALVKYMPPLLRAHIYLLANYSTKSQIYKIGFTYY